MSVKAHMDAIKAWMQEHAPVILNALAPPATEQDMAALEAKLGFPVVFERSSLLGSRVRCGRRGAGARARALVEAADKLFAASPRADDRERAQLHAWRRKNIAR